MPALEDIHIVDGYVGEGYALAGEAQLRAMYKVARTDGIIRITSYNVCYTKLLR